MGNPSVDASHATSGPTHVIIAGAGPAGLLSAINLLRRNGGVVHGVRYRVTVVDTTSDFGALSPEELKRHRSWMIGLSAHGLNAIKRVPGLYEKYVSNVGVRMVHNVIHLGSKELKVSADEFGDQYIVDRNYICAALARYLNENFASSCHLERMYGTKILYVDGENHRLLTRSRSDDGHEKEQYVAYDLLLGCDGIRSPARDAILKSHRDFECDVGDIFTKFKAVHIDRPLSVDAGAVHVMPGGMPKMNGIALPETGDKLNVSFGCFCHNVADDALQSDDPKIVAAYVKEHLKAFELLDYDDFAQQWVAQPWNTTGQVHCNFYHSLKIKALLMGDAAHATSPAIGMGMNTALADAAALDELMDQHRDQLAAVLPAFSRERVKEGNALTYLALHAYSMSMSQGLEMQIRGVVRKFFHWCFPRWVMEEPLATVAKGGKLSEAYDALVQLGRMQAVRKVNDAIRLDHFERSTGMVTHQKERSWLRFGSVGVLMAVAAGAFFSHAWRA